jgi:hypothetical protein
MGLFPGQSFVFMNFILLLLYRSLAYCTKEYDDTSAMLSDTSAKAEVTKERVEGDVSSLASS